MWTIFGSFDDTALRNMESQNDFWIKIAKALEASQHLPHETNGSRLSVCYYVCPHLTNVGYDLEMISKIPFTHFVHLCKNACPEVKIYM